MERIPVSMKMHYPFKVLNVLNLYVHSGLKTLTSTRIDLKDLIGAGKIPTKMRNAKNIETVSSQDKING